MRSLLLAAAGALLLSVPFAAHAAGAPMTIRQAEREARSFLTPCHYQDNRQGLCQQNQRNFVEEYVMALSGDYSAQGSTFTSFSVVERTCPNCDALSFLGMPADQIAACAWTMVLVMEPPSQDANSVNAHELARGQCAPLTDAQRNLVWSKAISLLARIKHHPLHVPDDWNPAAAELLPAASQ